MKQLTYLLVIILFNSCTSTDQRDNISFTHVNKNTNSLFEILSEREKLPLNTIEKSFFIKSICSDNDKSKTEVQNLEDGIFKAGIESPHSVPMIFSIRDDSNYILNS